MQERFNTAYKKHLKENMSFKSDIKEKVNEKLKSLAEKFYNKKPKDITYVGIHIRRTDYTFYYKKDFGFNPLKSDYYNGAMEYFKDEYENCIFVVASDDIKWAQKKLDKKDHHVYFSEQNPTFSIMTDMSKLYKPGTIIPKNYYNTS